MMGTQDFITKHKINWVYHITHIENLFSILKSGLHAHDIAHEHYCPADISEHEVNQRRNKLESIYNKPIHFYVPLYFNPKNPMSYRLSKQTREDAYRGRGLDLHQELAILHIDKEVLLSPKIVFTDGNAASNSTRFFGTIRDLDKLDWKCLRAPLWNDFDDGKRKRCAELLVPKTVPADKIKQISVKTELAKTEVLAYRPSQTRDSWSYDDEGFQPSSYDDERLHEYGDFFFGTPVRVVPDLFFVR